MLLAPLQLLLSPTLKTTRGEEITHLGPRLESKSRDGSHARDGITIFLALYRQLPPVERTPVHSILRRIRNVQTTRIVLKRYESLDV